MTDDEDRERTIRRRMLRDVVHGIVETLTEDAEELQDRELSGWLHDLLDHLDPLAEPFTPPDAARKL